MGKLIVIDGLDGSGKQTQAGLLEQALQQTGYPVRRLSFPTYTKSSALLEMYLQGELGGLQDVNVYAASSFYAADRYASYVQDWGETYRQGGLILTDRYVTANAIHQMSRLPKNLWEDYIDWLEDLEYTRFGLPRPDLVLFLDVPAELAVELIQKRYQGSENRLDLHERDTAYLLACRETALYAARRMNWKIVSCAEQDQMRRVEDIAAELLTRCEEFLNTAI